MSSACYLLGAVWDDAEPRNQLPRFLREGLWENGHETKFTDRVNAIAVGATVFIKASYYHNGFGEPVLDLRAKGTVRQNPQNGHDLIVDWDTGFQGHMLRESELAGIGRYRNTVEKVTEPTHLKAFLTGQLPKPVVPPEKQERYLDFARNQILFGPPGTGKTYHSVAHAVAIVEGKPVETVMAEAAAGDEGRQAVRDRFAEYQEQGQIEFATFHQAFSYEDFVEGIKPKTVNGQVQYAVEPGVFQRVSETAHRARRQAERLALGAAGHRKEQRFEQTYESFIEHLKAQLAKGNPVPMRTYQNKPALITAVDPTGTITTKHENSPYVFNVGQKWTRAVYEKYATPESVKPMNEKMLEIGGPNASLQWALFKLFKDFEAGFDTEDIAAEQPTPLETPVGGTVPRFVLIIDEINRGNVANIFGELITLLEEDKRAGQPEATTVRLPYSKLPFSVPDNLYLLGTMNTADRSVEALDTALRRRFSFTEMPPRPELLSPHQMVARLWLRHSEASWEDKAYRTDEKALYVLLGCEALAQEDQEPYWQELQQKGASPEATAEILADTLRGLTTDGLNLELMLKAINDRLAQLLDHDHCIGHALLMPARTFEALREVFRRSILPLLQEYFFGDWGRIGLVLGGAFVQQLNQAQNGAFALKSFGDYRGLDLGTKPVYRLVVPDSVAAFQAIYSAA